MTDTERIAEIRRWITTVQLGHVSRHDALWLCNELEKAQKEIARLRAFRGGNVYYTVPQAGE